MDLNNPNSQNNQYPQNYQPEAAQQKSSNNRGDRRRDGIRSIFSTLMILIIAPIIAWLMITFVFQSYEVDGPSMETTLSHSDRLIVWKIPKTIARITNEPYIPKRYEIVVFVKQGMLEYGDTSDRQLIKRVIGLPGERVVVRGGSVTVYNEAHPNGFNPDKGKEYANSITITNGNVDITVPDGELFVAGDNRTNSLDSRVFGTVPSDDIVGKLVLRILPLDRAEDFTSTDLAYL